MGTKVIDNNEARTPFFGDKMSFVTGLDPLGLQNPSTQAYSYLLPGLNNVTNRIRSYSFYCWLLEEFAATIKTEDPREQKKFIRRAEYIVALLSVNAGIENISGSNYAINRFKEGLEIFDLQKGTYNNDGSTDSTYWQSPFGIFGQYYIGSLRQVGLIEEPVNSNGEFIGLYRRTASKNGLKVSGADLAQAFNSNIKPYNKTTFFNCIKKGTVKIEELETLTEDFNLKNLELHNPEREQLLTLLLDFDEPLSEQEVPTQMRKDTILHILRFIKNERKTFNQRAFTQFAYKSKGRISNEGDSSLTGWYYYQLNEYYQVANTAVFNGSMDYLQVLVGPSWMSLPEFILTCKNEIIDYLVKTKFIKSGQNILEKVLYSKTVPEVSIYENIMSSTMVERMANGLLLLWSLYPANKDMLTYLREYTNERSIGDGDDVLTYYLNFENHLHKTIDDFVNEFLSLKIISRHEYVAYRKMGAGSQSTQKFIIENNSIRQIGNFEPGYTSPRINNLLNFLHDLKLLEDLTLTKSAEKLLKHY